MNDFRGKSHFGYASRCKDFGEVVALFKVVTGEDARSAVAAYGMLLSANSTEGGVYRDDALKVLTKLSFAKAELDSLACHTHPVIDVTSEILSQAQDFADRNTVPCTEWPTSDEVIANVLESAMKYVTVKEWKRVILSANGAVIGVEQLAGI